MADFWTENRKSIVMNGAAFGVVAAIGAVGTALMGSDPISLRHLGLTALGALMGAFVGYFNTKAAQFETGAKAGAKKAKLGL